MTNEAKPQQPEKVTATGCIGILIVCGAIGLGVYSCVGGDKPAVVQQTPKGTFEAVARDVFGNNLHKAEWNEFGAGEEGNHMVWFNVKASSEEAFMAMAGDQIYAFLKALSAKHGIRNPAGMTFLLMTELQDLAGVKSVEKVVNISFSAEWLKRAQWENLSGYRVLNAAQEVTPSNRVGGEILRAHVADPDTAQLTPRLNAMILSR